MDNDKPIHKEHEIEATAAQPAPAAPTRRDAVRRVAKLAFVAPVISTFFAHQAFAAASGNQSCYPTGHDCPGMEDCCSGVCAVGFCT